MTDDIIENLSNQIDELVDGTEDIGQLLMLWNENNRGLKRFEETIDRIRIKVIAYLKERRWTRYDDNDSKISVVISSQKKESFDREQLKILLSEAQYAMILRITTFEKVQIITPDMRKAMRKIVK